MQFVDMAREALEGKDTEAEKRAALNDVIDRCIEEGILAELLREHREEIIMTCILQYDQEAHETALYEEGHDAGYDKGHDVGYDEGDIGRLILQIAKKTSKGKSHSTIADEIEEDVSFVEEICSIAEKVSPEFDVKKIATEYLSRHKTVKRTINKE